MFNYLVVKLIILSRSYSGLGILDYEGYTKYLKGKHKFLVYPL